MQPHHSPSEGALMAKQSTETDVWGQRLRATRDAQSTATDVHEQTIRDARTLGRLSVSGIARELGIQNRNKITQVLNADRDVPPATAPTMPVTVYLRAPGHSEETWAKLRHAIYSRGWAMISDANSAWHLSRAGVTIVYVDLAAMLDDDPITVQLQRAVHRQPLDEPQLVPLADLLPTMEGIRLEREMPEAAAWQVRMHFDDEVRWKVLAGGQYPRLRVFDETATNNLGGRGAYCLDVQHVARRIADLI